MSSEIGLLDVVALTQDLPDERLARGQVGTVVESLSGDVWEVEFVDERGATYSTTALRSDQLMVLRHHPVEAL